MYMGVRDAYMCVRGECMCVRGECMYVRESIMEKEVSIVEKEGNSFMWAVIGCSGGTGWDYVCERTPFFFSHAMALLALCRS